jgi:hemoglobin
MWYRRPALLFCILLASGHSAKAQSLFDDLGEKPGIERIITQAMAIWAADPRVASTFEDTNLARFKRMIVDQICNISGGDCKYSGRSMADAHKGLHLATVQFNAVAEGLQTAMEQQHYSYPVQSRLLALLAPMQRDVVTR